MKRFSKLFILAICVLFGTTLFAQSGEYDSYLQTAEQRLREGNCEKAQSNYDVYKETTGKSNADLQRRINECKNPSAATTNNTNSNASSGSNFTTTVNGYSFTMVYVKGGTFTMGCTSEQGSDCWDEEKPAHSVTLSPYYMGQYEVTQGLWKAVMGNNPSYFKGDKLPVENVSWEDAQDFIVKLNRLTGEKFRLPTEAEWEYAVRGGSKSVGYKYSGTYSPDNCAWYDGNSGSTTHVVGTKSANELGIYDMSGNVWEWCQDWFGNYSSSSQTNPTGSNSGSFRVFRGGSWYFNARDVRVSTRNYRTPGNRSNRLGFRLARSSR